MWDGLLRGVGQPIGEFFSSENETFEQAYTTIYDARLEQLDTLREAFVSLTTQDYSLLVVSGLHLILFQTGSETSNPFEVILRARWVLLLWNSSLCYRSDVVSLYSGYSGRGSLRQTRIQHRTGD